MDAARHGLSAHGLTAQPQFVAYAVADLPALAPLVARHVFGLPLLTWVVRTRRRAAVCRALGRSDDFRGLSAMKRAQNDEAAKQAKSSADDLRQ
jgi:hypothetical protein